MYTVYEDRKYLVAIATNVSEDGLSTYGEIERKIWDNYPDCNPKVVGYVLKRGIHKFYAFEERKK